MISFFWFWVGCMIITAVVAGQKGLNVGLYFFISLLTGPLALFVVLMEKSKTARPIEESEFTLENARQHLFDIKRNIKYLMQKTETLEERINQLREPANQVVNQELRMEVESGHTVEMKTVESKPTPAQSSEGFELVFGKYWLNRIGVVLFVIGIGLFINYTFKYLNAFAKIGIGYAFSLAFFLWGRYLEKINKYTKIAWGILGGAWGLLYLSTYAMYYIEATRIISNSTVELLLLAAVSVLAIYYNLRYQSWVVTAITFILAFITVGLGGIDYSSVVYFALLAASIAYLSYQRNWHAFLICGIIGSYFTHLFLLDPTTLLHFPSTPQIYEFRILFGILVVSWLIYSLVFFLLRQTNEEEIKYLVTGKLLNAGCFIIFGFYQIESVRSIWQTNWNVKFWFSILLAAAYFLFSYVFKALKKERLVPINMVIAFTLVAVAIFIKAPQLDAAFYWILEMTMLFILGLYYREKIYRVLAGAMSIFIMFWLFFYGHNNYDEYRILVFQIKQNTLIFTFAAVSFYVLSFLTEIDRFKKEMSRDERNLYASGAAIFGTVLITFLLSNEMALRWLSLSWTLFGAGLLVVGFFLKNKMFRLCALGVLSLACLRVLLIDMADVNTIYKIMAFIILGALLLGISIIYSKYKIQSK